MYWWFETLRGTGLTDPNVQHPYYRALYKDADKHLEIALTCAVAFKEYFIPPVDSPLPDSKAGKGYSVPELGLKTDWDPIGAGGDLLRKFRSDIFDNSRITEHLLGLDGNERDLEIQYALSDAIFSHRLNAPVVSSQGRSTLVSLLAEMGVLDSEIGTQGRNRAQQDRARASLVEQVGGFHDLIGFSFKRDSVERIARIRKNRHLRAYRRGFQNALTKDEPPSTDLADLAVESVHRAKIADDVSSLLAFGSRTLSVSSLIPVVGTVTGVAALLSDGASGFFARQSRKNSWFELPTEIRRFQDKEMLYEHLSRPQVERSGDPA